MDDVFSKERLFKEVKEARVKGVPRSNLTLASYHHETSMILAAMERDLGQARNKLSRARARHELAVSRCRQSTRTARGRKRGGSTAL